MSPEKANEIILGITRTDLFGEDGSRQFEGVMSLTDSHRLLILMQHIHQAFTTRRRGNVEDDPSFKQLIPYVILTQDDRIFTYERLTGGGEARLFHKRSIGVGGHMNPIPEDSIHHLDFGHNLYENMWRELNEELVIAGAEGKQAECLGLINDEQTDVNAVHLGLLYRLDLPKNATVSIRETDKLEGSWLTANELKTPLMLNTLEDWSKLAVLHAL